MSSRYSVSRPDLPRLLASGELDPAGLQRDEILDGSGACCPPDLEVPVFGIGTAKSRTTWLARCLDEHPDVHVSRPKEPHFFSPYRYPYDTEINDRFLSRWSWYAERYVDAEPGKTRADFSNTTINHGEVTAPLLKALYPDARFIVCLRDPVTRTYSHYWNTVREPQVKNVPPSFEAALRHGELVRRSRYHDLLLPWFQHFPRERFLIHFDFEMDEDPHRVVADTFRFLGKDASYVASSVDRRVNAPAQRNGGLRKARRAAERLNALGLRPLVRAAKGIGVERFLSKRERKPAPYPRLSQRQAERLYEDLAPSVDALERLVGRDLSPWRQWETDEPLVD